MGIVWSFLKRVFKSASGRHGQPTAKKESESPDPLVNNITTPIQSPNVPTPPTEPIGPSNFEPECFYEESNSIEVPNNTDDHQQFVDRYPSIDISTHSRLRFQSDKTLISPTQLSDVRDQLLSIPPEHVTEVEDRPPPRPNVPDPPLTFDKLIEYVIPASIFKYLDIQDVIRSRTISTHLHQIADDYLLHRILPRTDITFYLKYISRHDPRTEKEYEHLTPVIRRIDKEKRMLPHGRVVYEPEYTGVPKHLQRRGKFEPEGIMFRLNMNDRIRKFYWPLVANAGRPARSTRDSRYGEDRYRSHSFELKYTLMHEYYRFESFKGSPIYVFYKEQRDRDPPNQERNQVQRDRSSVRLHAISIPIEYLRWCFLTGHGHTD